MRRLSLPALLRPCAGLAVSITALHAQFVVDAPKIPETGSSTENVDFADIDLDGDWDVAVADGAEIGNDQNRIWVNQGGLQGGELGLYLDKTSTQAPAVLDASRDIEFVDFDGDGDPDVNVSNTSTESNQPNRWWTNRGGLQGGTAGFYVDETAARWVGLGGPGSSIPSALLLTGGGFIDWSGDSDFGDLDMDGDLDLVHSSYGQGQGGGTPTRIFLNDGLGFFSEFNPSGFQLTLSKITAGDPGLWCDGIQTPDTLDATGAQCDIASTALDVHVGDVDGDLDLDILHGAKNQPPRMFANRLEASSLAPGAGAGLGFRDVTGAAFPAGYATSSHHYAQELGDLDGDGDLDILGLDWVLEGALHRDVALANDGTGHYGAPVVLPGSTEADNECDFLDYDNDGDLDVYVATFSGGDLLYRNDQDGGAAFSFIEVPLPPVSKFTYDADACDTDRDGDYDVLAAEEVNAHETFYRNTTEVPDTHAPAIPRLEQLADGPAAAGERLVRAHVYDNAPYYITWYNPTWLEVDVGGVALTDRGMRSSAGQIFRGTLEQNLLGAVSYRVRSQDEHGNTGFSAVLSYTSTGGPAGTLYGATTSGSLGPPSIAALSLPLAGETLYLAAGNLPAGTPCFIAVSGAVLPSSLDLGSGFLLQIALPAFLVTSLTADAGGHAVISGQLPPGSAGVTLACQAVSIDGTGGNLFATSQGLSLPIP